MRRLVLAVTAAAVALGATACGGAGPTNPPAPSTGSAPAAAASAPATGTASAAPTARRVVPLTDDRLTVRREPADDAPVVTRLRPSTPLGSPLVLLAGRTVDGWVEVLLPVRPNGGTGWVDADQVQLEPVDARIDVDLASRTLRLTLDGTVAAQTAVAIGTTENPTPTGEFYVTDRVRPENPHGAYGSFALGLSAHSETLSEFGGGDGQIGIHGTDDAGSIGRRASHGCIRVPASVAGLLAAVPLGTPVLIA